MNHNNSETHLIISKKAYTYFTLNNFEYFIITFEIKFLWSTSQFFFLKNDDPVQFLNFRKKDAWLMQRLLMSFGTYLNFLANYPKSKRLKQKLSNQNLVLDAQSLHKAQWYSNRSYIFFFRFFSSSAITDVGWRNNGYCKFHNTITGKNFKILHAIVQFNLSVWLSLSSPAIVLSITIL